MSTTAATHQVSSSMVALPTISVNAFPLSPVTVSQQTSTSDLHTPPFLVRGKLCPDLSRRPCVLVSPTWFGWFYLLDTFKLHAVECYCDLGCPWVQQATTLPSMWQWIAFSDFPLATSPLYNSSGVLLIIHGPSLTLDFLPTAMYDMHHILYLTSCTDFQHVSLPHQILVSHREAGGALNGSWTFVSNRPFKALTTAPPRLPSQIIKPTIASTGPAAVEGAPTLEIASDPLPVDCHRHLLVCPTVYGSTVTRHLVFDELLSAFDVPNHAVPEGLRHHLIEAIPRDDNRYVFLREVPLKVLHKVFESWQEVPYVITSSGPHQGITHSMWELPTIMYAAGKDFEVEATSRQAVKSDDAQVPVHLWDDRVWSAHLHDPQLLRSFKDQFQRCPLDSLRAALLRVWRKLVRRCLCRYLSTRYGTYWWNLLSASPILRTELCCGRDCIRKAANADWWEWRGGSSLMFWRWPLEFRDHARDGHPIWVQAELPCYKRPQRPEPDPLVRQQTRAKLENVLLKGYVQQGTVSSLTSYFAVPKGPEDVRIVYDSSKSGLNAAIWVPTFSLPTVESLTNMLDGASWMSDLDMGEQFLNFPLDPNLRPYCGIDVRPYLGAPNGRATHWLRWSRCMMGLRSSPYIAIKATHIAEEWVFGNRFAPTNPFGGNGCASTYQGRPPMTPLNLGSPADEQMAR